MRSAAPFGGGKLAMHLSRMMMMMMMMMVVGKANVRGACRLHKQPKAVWPWRCACMARKQCKPRGRSAAYRLAARKRAICLSSFRTILKPGALFLWPMMMMVCVVTEGACLDHWTV